jgi:hypothetical protein
MGELSPLILRDVGNKIKGGLEGLGALGKNRGGKVA